MDNMILIWKCLKCGFIFPCSDEQCQVIPDTCPECNASKEEFVQVEED